MSLLLLLPIFAPPRLSVKSSEELASREDAETRRIWRKGMIVRYAMLVGIIGMTCACALGCGYAQPVSVAADYGDFYFSRYASGKKYELFGLDLDGSDQQPPSIEIMLPYGTKFNCDSITVESAKDYFPYHMDGEAPVFDQQLKKVIQLHSESFGTDKEYSTSINFRNGKLQSVSVRPDTKFRFAYQKEFVSLPLSASKMEQLFGKPKKYKSVYATHP